jgi:hypothetical protein
MAIVEALIVVSTDMIWVVVGPEAKSFLIYESIITSTSEFLQTTMRSPWAEQRQGPIKLTTNFQIYVHWLYRRKLVIVAAVFNEKTQRNQSALVRYGANLTKNGEGQAEIKIEDKDEDDLEIIILAKALIMGEKLMDDAFIAAVETKFVAFLQGKHFRAGGKAGHFIWTNSAQYSRPRQIVIAQALSFAGLNQNRGFYSNVKDAVERLKEEDPTHWKLELYAGTIFAKAGVGRDPVTLALELLRKRPESMLQSTDIKTSFKRVQEQARLPRPDDKDYPDGQ